MRIEHRTPVTSWFAVPESDPVDPEYDVEVQRATRRAEREYRRAQDRLQRAEERLAEAQRRQQAQRRVTQLRQEVDLRRAELEDWRRLMTATPVMQEDKQIRHRTGLDDHLELGEYRRPKRKKRKAS